MRALYVRRGCLRAPHFSGDHSFGGSREAVVAATAATAVLGISSGGILAAKVGPRHPELAVALFEPALVADGSLDLDAFLRRFDPEVARGDVPASMVTALLGTQTGPGLPALLPTADARVEHAEDDREGRRRALRRRRLPGRASERGAVRHAHRRRGRRPHRGLPGAAGTGPPHRCGEVARLPAARRRAPPPAPPRSGDRHDRRRRSPRDSERRRPRQAAGGGRRARAAPRAAPARARRARAAPAAPAPRPPRRRRRHGAATFVTNVVFRASEAHIRHEYRDSCR